MTHGFRSIARSGALGTWLATAIVLASASGPARATSPAEELFQQGRELMLAGQTDAACARFAESYAMVASSGALLNLALCHQTQGKTATAWNEYRAAARLARNQGREDRASVADGKAKALEATLARLTTTAVEAVAGLRVATEAGALGDGGLGVEVPIDPGTHKMTVTAPGYLPWTTTLEVKPGQQIAIEIPRLEAEPLPPALARAAPSAGGGLGDNAEGAATRRSALGLYLGGGGGVLLVAGTVFWSVAYAKFQSAQDACAAGCSRADHDGRISDIQSLKGIAVGTWIAGGALLVASGAYVTLRRGRTAPSVALAPHHAGLSIHGSF
jgi:hypothetical protein